MVKKETIKNKEYYQCEICKFYYKEKKQAEKCQAWCDKHHSCNMKITKDAVDPRKEENKGGCC